MKINATLVKPDGLYGMVMPEKPNSNLLKAPGTYGGIQWRIYKDSVKFAKDAAVRYEDQDKANELTWNSHPESDLYGKGLENFKKSCYKFKEGEVYPLPEPLVVIEIWQYQVKGYPNWNNCVRGEIEPLYKNSKFNYRTLLRISQGTDNKSLDPELSSIKARNKVFAGFGSEGGEPTRKVIAGCRYSKCDCASGDECFEYEKVGVEEKKEPETAFATQQHSCFGGHWSIVCSCEGECQANKPNRGVSEREEPTQEELLTELVGLVYKREDAPPEEHERFWNEIKSKFIITRRA